MRIAFKEWAVIVDALGRGDQILIFRKGGISEGKGGFQPEHSRFLLFPTLFHQQRESVLPPAQRRYDAISASFPPKDRLRIEYWAEVHDALLLNSLQAAEALRGQHVWRDEVITQRFDWGREKSIFALAIRVHRLSRPAETPMLDDYGGCKSWVELRADMFTEFSQPVLSDSEFAERLQSFRGALLAQGASAS